MWAVESDKRTKEVDITLGKTKVVKFMTHEGGKMINESLKY